MKCEHCGGNLSLNDKYCPHCGSINEQARRHVEDMEHYEGEFEETKDKVYAHTRRFTQFTVRIVVISVLLVVGLVMIMLGNNVWDLEYDYKTARAEARYDEYSKALDQLLADEDYFGFYQYTRAHNIQTYQGKYRRYAKIYTAANYYTDIYQDIMTIHHPLYYDPGDEEDLIEELVHDLNYYYNQMADPYEYYELDEELTEATVPQITAAVEALLVAYCGLDTDEAASLAGLTQARRGALVEDRALPIVTENIASLAEEQD